MSPDATLPESFALSATRLQPGTLWQKTLKRTDDALHCGALIPIATDYEIVEEDDIPFIVRAVLNIQRKQADRRQQSAREATGTSANPFFFYYHNLFFADIFSIHVCLLNKFNVVNHHLLLITRAFESQESLLTQADFEALAFCLEEFDSLAFYNSGSAAGASQPHKHLQLIPLPMTAEGASLPIATQVDGISSLGEIGQLAAFPFVHGCIRFDLERLQDCKAAAQTLLDTYHHLLYGLGLSKTPTPNAPPLGAYNLLATRHWMVMVRRSLPEYNGLLVNALGFGVGRMLRGRDELPCV
jgi:ATP adenylyltransferase